MCKAVSGPPRPRVRLRNLEPRDLPTLFWHQLDPDAARLAAVVPRGAEEFEVHWAKVLADRSIVAKSILADEALVGQITCFPMEGQDNVGYWIAKEHWGRGIASEALALLVAEVARRPLYARAARHNLGSIRVLERSGFAITGYRASPGSERFLACEEVLLTLL